MSCSACGAAGSRPSHADADGCQKQLSRGGTRHCIQSLTESGRQITSTDMTMALRNSSPGSDCSSRCAHLHVNHGPEDAQQHAPQLKLSLVVDIV